MFWLCFCSSFFVVNWLFYFWNIFFWFRVFFFKFEVFVEYFFGDFYICFLVCIIWMINLRNNNGNCYFWFFYWCIIDECCILNIGYFVIFFWFIIECICGVCFISDIVIIWSENSFCGICWIMCYFIEVLLYCFDIIFRNIDFI